MNILDRIQIKSSVDVAQIVVRLEKEFAIKATDENQKFIYWALFDTQSMIFNITHRNRIISEMESLWVRMTKDYWYLCGNDKKILNQTEETKNNSMDNSSKVESISVGDAVVKFADNNNVTIDNITYKTGTIEFADEVLKKRYSSELYRFRKMRW